MQIRFKHLALLALLVTVGHFAALKLELYKGKIWVDMPLHFTSGIALGLLAIWILENLKNKLSGTALIIWVTALALAGSFVWELFEFLLHQFAPDIALNLRLYSPRVSDVLSDMTFGALGGLAISIIYPPSQNTGAQ